jgi:hypothetical protein
MDHPLGGRLAERLLDYMRRSGDLQTVALMSAALAQTSAEGALFTRCVCARAPPQSPPPVPDGVCSPRHKAPAPPRVRHGHFDPKTPTSPRESGTLVDHRSLAHTAAHREAYADFLLASGLVAQRAELLKARHMPEAALSQTFPVVSGPNPGAPVTADLATVPRSHCFVCNLTARGGPCRIPDSPGSNDAARAGLSLTCRECLHGGHAQHVQQWFAEHSECPSGCGCRWVQRPAVAIVRG